MRKMQMCCFDISGWEARPDTSSLEKSDAHLGIEQLVALLPSKEFIKAAQPAVRALQLPALGRRGWARGSWQAGRQGQGEAHSAAFAWWPAKLVKLLAIMMHV